MLEHASGSQHIDPGRPPAAAGGLVSHRCQTSFLAPSAAALTPASCSKLVEEIRPAPSAHELEGVRRLDSLGYHTGPSEPQRTRSGRTTC